MNFIKLSKLNSSLNDTTNLAQDAYDGSYYNRFLTSGRNYTNGYLIRTNINYSSGGCAFLLEIKSNTYGSCQPLYYMAQGYIFNGSIINTGAILMGTNIIGTLNAFALDDKLCFWFHYYSYWQGFSVKCSRVEDERRENNTVTSIENSAMPSSATNNVTINPYICYSTANLSFNLDGSTLYINA